MCIRDRGWALGILLKIIGTDVLLLGDIEEGILVDGRGRALALELEDHNSIIMPGGEQVDFRMSGDDPKPIVLPLKGLDQCPLIQIPDADGLIFAGGQDEILMGVKETAASVLEMAPAGIDFPGLGLAHTPQLDKAVVAGRHDKGHRRVEGYPIDPPIVALEDKLDDGIGVSKHVGLGILPRHLVLEGHGSRGAMLFP